MRLYFSGVAGRAEAGMLRKAGVCHALADPTDLPHAQAAVAGREGARVALDCGAYRAWRNAQRQAQRDGQIRPAPFDLDR